MAVDHFEEYRSMLHSPWWNFNVLFNDQPAVEQMVKAYAKPLQHPGLYPPIPAMWLHATILAVGQVNDFSEQQMLAVAETLQPKLSALELPEFIFDPWWILGSIELHITPGDQFAKIYHLVEESLMTVVGPDKTRQTSDGRFKSHVTLAYSKTHQREHEIHKQLSDNPVQPASFRVDKLSLVKQHRKDGHYEWNVFKDLHIGSTTSAL